MNSKFSALSQKYLKEANNILSDWIKIPSVYDEKTIAKGQPFGLEVNRALAYIGWIAERDGFEVTYNDGYATEISFGQGPLIGVYAHADVVPVSGTWTYPPFSGTVTDDRIYGRGATDDKGPAVASYLAMRLLKDHSLIKGYRVRLVIGGNEERGSACLHHYFHALKKPHAVAGFTPDGEFPLIYGEKGITNYKIEGRVDLSPIRVMKAGVVSNSVADRAEAVIDRDVTLEKALAATGYNYSLTHDEKTTRLTILGRAAHGSMPELGVNAGIQMMQVLGDHYGLEVLKRLAYHYQEPFGRHLDAYYESELLHHSTYNVGLINYQDNLFSMVVNFRYPETVSVKDTIKHIQAVTPLPITVTMTSRHLLFDPQSAMVQTLLRAYQEESGDTKTAMMTIGGGTYAKEAENIIAFGPGFPGQDDHIHDFDEKIDLRNFHQSIAIYARAIDELGRLYAAKE
ncbi:MAG: Sapep family Mn(2+)-dependent dipeptidase [Bacilli bacterium]|jgi:succinyl-diaminopimelate desuccinylase